MSGQTTKETTTANLLNLQLMKNYDPSQIITSSANGIETKATKNIFSLLKLGIFGIIGFCVIKFVLPPVFIALGKVAAIIATIVAVILFIVFLPTMLRWFKHWAKELDKKLINKDPFNILDLARKKLVDGLSTTRGGIAKFSKFRDDAQNESERYEAQAKNSQITVVRLSKETKDMRAKLEEMLAKNGPDYANEDEYISLDSTYQKELAKSLIVSNQLNQAKDFVERYGSRAATIQKVLKKAKNGETALEIKIADFDATYAWLKEQYKFAKEAKFMSGQMKEALLFEEEWQFLYAIDAISNTINVDMATTSDNFKQLDSITSQYNVNSEEQFLKLTELADSISGGSDVVTESKRYENPNVQLTQKEQRKSGFNGLDF